MRSARRTWLGAILLVAGAVAIFLSGMRHSYQYFQTVSEFAQTPGAYVDRGVRINGMVDSSSVEWQPDSLLLRFRLTDGQSWIPVEYHGVAPDLFQAGQNVVVEGKVGHDGVFRATQILVKCPSKYEPVGESPKSSL